MKRGQWMAGLLIVSLLALLWAGCKNESGSNNLAGPGPITEPEEQEDIADDFAYAMAGDGEGMMSYWNSDEGGGGPMGAGSDREQRALDDTLIFVHGGFQVVLVRNYYDADGIWSPIYNPLTSVRMEWLLDVNGTHTNQSGRRTVTVDHSDRLMIWGIAPTESVYRFEGDGDRTVEGEFASRFRQNVRTISATYEWDVNSVLIHHNRWEHPYPLDGSIAVEVDWMRTHENPGRDWEEHGHASFVVYFDGTRYAQLVFSNGMTFWIDLQDGICWRERP